MRVAHLKSTILIVTALLAATLVLAQPPAVRADASTAVGIPDRIEDTSRASFGHPQITIDAAGLPVLAYPRYEVDQPPALRVVRCDDPDCAGLPEAFVELTLWSDGLDAIEVTSLALDPFGNPIIAVSEIVYGGFDVRTPLVVQCNDPSCAHSDVSVQAMSEPTDGLVVSNLLVQADGSLIQAMASQARGSMSVVTCSGGSCADGDRNVSTLPVFFPYQIEAALDSSGQLVLAYGPTNNGTINLIRCFDALCLSATPPTALSDDTWPGRFAMTLDSNDNPVVAFDSANKLWVCDDPGCSSDGDGVVATDSNGTGNVQDKELLLRPDGSVVLVTPFDQAGLRVLTCPTTACNSATNNRVDDRLGIEHRYGAPAAALDAEGLPVIAWATSDRIVVAHCGNELCGVPTTCDGYPITVDMAAGETQTSGNDVILGTSGDDSIGGGAGDDVICGRGGNDNLWGQAGNDRIFGGDGDDRVRGGAGNDVLFGQAGRDDVAGGTDYDQVYGGDGDDIALRGGTGDDQVSGGPGNDQLINGNGGSDGVGGEAGDDRVIGGPRPDWLYGGDGNDVLKGNTGADTLFGGFGDDELFGGPGGDVLYGMDGIDVCNGGTSRDGAAEFDEASEYCETLINIP